MLLYHKNDAQLIIVHVVTKQIHPLCHLMPSTVNVLLALYVGVRLLHPSRLLTGMGREWGVGAGGGYGMLDIARHF